MDEQRQLQLIEKLENFSHAPNFNSERFLELLTICKNTELSSNRRRKLCNCLILLLCHNSHISDNPMLVQRIERLFLRFAGNFDIYNACQIWKATQNSVLEKFILQQKWLHLDNWSKYKYGSDRDMEWIFIKFSLKQGNFFELTNFLNYKQFADYSPYLSSSLYDTNASIRQGGLNYCRQLKQVEQEIVTQMLSFVGYGLATDYNEPLDWLSEQEYYPANNKVRVVISLINGVFAEHNAENETIIRLLFEIIQTKRYNERGVPDKAKGAIRELRTTEGRDIFCRMVLDMLKTGKSHKELEALAVEMDYAPPVTLDKILYFFLTRQFDKYDRLDFDRSVMFTLYSTSEIKGLRQHINTTVRESGRLDYLDIIAPRTETSLYSQQKTTIDVLRSNGQWAQLWQKVFDFSFWGSVSALGVLRKNNWQPADDYERELFTCLNTIVQLGFTNRGLKIQPLSLVERPFGVNALEHLTALKAANTTKAELSPAEQNALAYIEAVLRYRFRHDIEVEFAPEVQPDRFDIELESEQNF